MSGRTLALCLTRSWPHCAVLAWQARGLQLDDAGLGRAHAGCCASLDAYLASALCRRQTAAPAPAPELPSPCLHEELAKANPDCQSQGLDNPFRAARYHSLVIEKDSCPDELEVTAWTEDGTIMGVRHRRFRHIQGVQFHPESIITDNGMRIVSNFVRGL